MVLLLKTGQKNKKYIRIFYLSVSPARRAPHPNQAFPSRKGKDVTALRCSEPLRSKVGGPSKVFAMLCGMGPPGERWGIGWVLPCRKAWWQRMVIELGLSSGYLMDGLLFPARFIAERIFGQSCKPSECIIRKTKCYRFTKRNVPKRKTKRLRYRCPPEPYSNSVRTDFFSYSNAITNKHQHMM